MDTRDMERKAEAAMRGGLSCTEAILSVFNAEFNLGLDEKALKMATGFAGGVGGKKNICGALTGAVLVIGAMKGRTSPEQKNSEAMELTADVFDNFEAVFGDVHCSEILKDKEISCPGIVVPTCVRILLEAI